MPSGAQSTHADRPATAVSGDGRDRLRRRPARARTAAGRLPRTG